MVIAITEGFPVAVHRQNPSVFRAGEPDLQAVAFLRFEFRLQKCRFVPGGSAVLPQMTPDIDSFIKQNNLVMFPMLGPPVGAFPAVGAVAEAG